MPRHSLILPIILNTFVVLLILSISFIIINLFFDDGSTNFRKKFLEELTKIFTTCIIYFFSIYITQKNEILKIGRKRASIQEFLKKTIVSKILILRKLIEIGKPNEKVPQNTQDKKYIYYQIKKNYCSEFDSILELLNEALEFIKKDIEVVSYFEKEMNLFIDTKNSILDFQKNYSPESFDQFKFNIKKLHNYYVVKN